MFITNTLYESCLRTRLLEKKYIELVKPTTDRFNVYGIPDLFDTDRRERCKLHESAYHGFIKTGEKETSFILVITGDSMDIASVRSLKRYIVEEIGWKYDNFHIVTVYFTDNFAKLSYASDIDTVIIYNGKVTAKKFRLRSINRRILRDLLEVHRYAIASQKGLDFTNYDGFSYFGGYNVTLTYFLAILITIAYFRANALNLSGVNVHSVMYERNFFTLISAMFVHANISHLIGNVIALLFIGKTFESYVGSLKTFIVFFVSGILGNLISVAYKLDTGSLVTLVGASGAIFGLLGGLTVIESYDFNAQKFMLKNFLVTAGVSALYIWFCGTGSANVDNACHIGGFLSGMFITIITECIARYFEVGVWNLSGSSITKANKKYALAYADDLAKAQIEKEEERNEALKHDLSRVDGYRKVRF